MRTSSLEQLLELSENKYMSKYLFELFKINLQKFFLGKLYQKLIMPYTLATQRIDHADFGYVWTTSWLDE